MLVLEQLLGRRKVLKNIVLDSRWPDAAVGKASKIRAAGGAASKLNLLSFGPNKDAVSVVNGSRFFCAIFHHSSP